MFEMQSDLTRKHKLQSASKDAIKTGRIPAHTIVERAAFHREQTIIVKKGRIPWITIISIISVIPFFMGGNNDAVMSLTNTNQQDLIEIENMIQSLDVPNIINKTNGQPPIK